MFKFQRNNRRSILPSTLLQIPSQFALRSFKSLHIARRIKIVDSVTLLPYLRARPHLNVRVVGIRVEVFELPVFALYAEGHGCRTLQSPSSLDIIPCSCLLPLA